MLYKYKQCLEIYKIAHYWQLLALLFAYVVVVTVRHW